MRNNSTGILDKLGLALGIIGLAVAAYGLAYVLTLNGEQLFAIPMLMAVNFLIISLPLSVAGLIVSLIARKKNKDSVFSLIGIISAAVAVAFIIIFVCVGAYSLTLNDFTSYWNSYIFKDGSYSTVVSELFEGLHGDNWTF